MGPRITRPHSAMISRQEGNRRRATRSSRLGSALARRAVRSSPSSGQSAGAGPGGSFTLAFIPWLAVGGPNANLGLGRASERDDVRNISELANAAIPYETPKASLREVIGPKAASCQ